ncbi:MAG: hypothetical protein ACUZ8H_06410, partial [Candidatus Anammoxibacter sp.]
SGFDSDMKHQRDIVSLLKIISSDRFGGESILRKYKDQDLHKIINELLCDKSEKRGVFKKRLNDETANNKSILTELNDHAGKRHSEEKASFDDLLNKKNEKYAGWLGILDEKEKLQIENTKKTAELNDFFKRKESVASKKEYLSFKYSEYGDEDRIKAVFEQLSKEYDNGKIEETSLREEYDKARQDEKIIPRVCNDTKLEMKALRDEMDRAKYEINAILEAYPNIRDLAKESGEITVKYNEVHEELERTTKTINDLRANFEKVSGEETEVRKDLDVKMKKLEPFIGKEKDVKSGLTNLMERFDRQEELQEEKSVFNDIVGPLEKKLRGWREKIDSYEVKSAAMNNEIETLKNESSSLTTELTEYEALVGPVKVLKTRMEKVVKDAPDVEGQEEVLTKEIRDLKKANEMLSIKARQFEMVKRKLEGKI